MLGIFLFSTFYFFIEQVLIPNKVYNGQKFTKLVRAKTVAATTATIPKIPVIVPL